jgi:hypothetical protein
MEFQNYYLHNSEKIHSFYKTLITGPITAKKILEYLYENIIQLLEGLNDDEKLLFYYAYKKDGVFLSHFSQRDKNSFNKALELLESKGLVVLKSNISHVNLQYKLFLFEEVREIIEREHFIITEKDFIQKIALFKESSLVQKMIEIPLDLFQYFYSYCFFVPKKFLYQQQNEKTIEYLYKEKLVKEKLFVVESFDKETQTSKIIYETGVELIGSPIEKNKLTVTGEIEFKTRIYNDFIGLCFNIYKDGINFTKKNEINKKHAERILKDFASEHIFLFFIDFLRKNNYFEKVSSQEEEIYKLNSNIFQFFHTDMKETYKTLIANDPFVDNLLKMLLSFSLLEFSLADIMVKFFSCNIESLVYNFFFRDLRRFIVKAVEFLFYSGMLIKFFTQEGVVFYKLSELAKMIYTPFSLKESKESKEKSLSLSSSFQIIANPQIMSYQTSYILNIFTEIDSLSTVFSYLLNKASFYQALYFGFKGQLLIDILIEHSSISENTSTIDLIKEWESNYKSGEIFDAIMLKTSKTVLDQLIYQPEYRDYILERISDEYAIVTKNLKDKKILEENNIYIWTR